MKEELERLVESDSREHYEGTAGYLLFTTDSAVVPFVKYEEQLAEINDYCFYLLQSLRKRALEAETAAHGVEGHVPEMWNYQYGKVLSWKFLYQDINKCIMLLLPLAFFESTLNEIANWFSDITGHWPDWKK